MVRSAAILFVALVGAPGVQVAHGAEPDTSYPAATIEVNGTGEVDLDPDRAALSIAVETRGETSAAAAAENATLMAAVTQTLLAAGAARSGAAPRLVGYEAQNTLRVSVKQLPALGKWIDAALGAGAARVENIDFDSSLAPSARQEALAKAVADARQDAETLAKAAGGTLGPLQSLSTVEAGGPRPVMTLAAPRPIQAGEETHLEASPLHVSASVTARWVFEP